MIRLFLSALVACAASGQSVPASLRVVSNRDGRHELYTATIVDLVSKAYGIDAGNVVGGPSWLEIDRFDVIIPAGGTPEMLQALLADRFKLVVHKDTRTLSAFVLTAGKHPLLKQSEGTGPGGCEERQADHTPAMNGGLACRNMTMAAFTERLSLRWQRQAESVGEAYAATTAARRPFFGDRDDTARDDSACVGY